MKIKAKKITLDRAEGLSIECGPQPSVTTFKEADAQLKRMARTAPKTGCYDKTDFEIVFEDGETYNGRYDLKHEDYYKANLASHVREFLMFYGGLVKLEDLPSHLTPKQYREFLAHQKPESMKEIAAFLDKYQIGDVSERESICLDKP